MVEYAVIDIGMGLGSVELDWDPDSDMDPILCRSGRECLDAFLLAASEFHCCAEWACDSDSAARLSVCML